MGRRMPVSAPFFDDRELQKVAECLESRWVTQGPMGAEFERLFAERHAVPYCCATTSCTAALHLAIMACGIGPGDDVIVPAFTWVTSAHCAEYAGARAVFADIDPATFNITGPSLVKAMTPRTRAIIAVHLFGLAAPMDDIMAFAQDHSLVVIEDAACATGTTYGDQPVGHSGHAACFSFHPRKIITTGEGGMVATTSADIAARVRSLRNNGSVPSTAPRKPYSLPDIAALGYNLRLSDIQAAVGIAQMEKLDALLAERKMRAERYSAILAHTSECALPGPCGKCHHTYQSYVIRLVEGAKARRDHIMDFLASHGIETRPGTHAVHRLSYYARKYSLRPEDFPASAGAEDTTISLPLFPAMTDADQDFITDRLFEALRSS